MRIVAVSLLDLESKEGLNVVLSNCASCGSGGWVYGFGAVSIYVCPEIKNEVCKSYEKEET
jgi:hypothetical protein